MTFNDPDPESRVIVPVDPGLIAETDGRDRDAASRSRDEQAEERSETAASRDRAAAIRDRGAENRDDRAHLRDVRNAGEANESVAASDAQQDRVRSAADRDDAASDRALATVDREQATQDRSRAASDRHEAAGDRARGLVARDEALREHADAISVLVNAASTLALLTADELQAAHRLGSLVDAAEDAMISKDLEGTIQTWNPSAERVYGYSVVEAVGQSVRMLLPSGQAPELPGIFSRFARGERVAHYQSKRLRKDGVVIDVSLTVSPIRGSEGDIVGATTISRDITAELVAQATRDDQLRQSQKLEAIGSLAGGIAHDFNNILTVIRGNTAILLEASGIDAFRERLNEIDKAAELAAAVTGQLLAFSRQQVLEAETVDVNRVATSMCDLIERLIGDAVHLERQLQADPALIVVDSTQLQQVVLNLCVNARDAMSDGGTLLVRTESVVIDEGYALSHVEIEAGRYVLLEITDTGVGMDAATRVRIFDPFFTTKSEGTGLGLSTVFGVVKQSGGNISVYSEPGGGTTIKVYFPEAAGAEHAPRTVQPVVASARGRGETVLFVEDFDVLRALSATMLEAAGYTVLTAASGSEALLLFEQRGEDIDLLLTDLMMPQMDGKDLAEQLLLKNPKLKVIFTSGYPAQIAIGDRLLSERVAFIQKPYSSEDLSTRVRVLLDSTS